jgi:hypothetical protein
LAEIRIDPPERDRTFLDAAKDIARFYVSPVSSILGKATSRDNRDVEAYGTLPLIVDTATATVRALPMNPAKGKARYVVEQRNKNAAEAARQLTDLYVQGVAPPNLPPGYRAAAEIVSQLRDTDPPDYIQNAIDANDELLAYRRDREQPVVEPPGADTWETQMPGFLPPGGMAGFSQMTNTSKLALTRLRRATGRKRRTKKRKASGTKRKRTTKRASRKSSRRKLVKGSAAAKRFMANLRKRRK